MLTLAVVKRAETFERMVDPLADRGIDVKHLQASGNAIDLGEPPRESFDCGFVYPSRPIEGGVIDARYGIPWVNGPQAVWRSRNKAAVIATLSATDIPTPQTQFISNPADPSTLESVFRAIDGPVVIKPTSTTRGVGITRVDDLDSFLGVTDYLGLIHDFPATADRSFLVQEYVPEARDLRVMIVDGSYVGAVERAQPSGDGWKHNVHRGGTATAIDPPERIRRLAEATAEAVGLSYCGVDCLVTPERVLVSETNARPTIDDASKYVDDFWDRLARQIQETAT